MHGISTFDGLPVCSTMVQLSFKVITTLQRKRFRRSSHSEDTAIQAAQIAWPMSLSTSPQLQLRQSSRPEGVISTCWQSTLITMVFNIQDFYQNSRLLSNLLYSRSKEGGGINYNNLILKPLREKKNCLKVKKMTEEKKSRQMFPLKSKGSSTCACMTVRHQPLATETPSHTLNLCLQL